jgi:DNA-directed RNA polymerase subunit K/omega
MIHRPATANSFEFVIVSALRAVQLMRGCTPGLAASSKAVVTAQREVAAGMVKGSMRDSATSIAPAMTASGLELARPTLGGHHGTRP